MPIPSPNDGEKKGDFISRCMSNDTMVAEYPKKTQRVAICNDKWNKRKKSIYELVSEGVKALTGNCGCGKK